MPAALSTSSGLSSTVVLTTAPPPADTVSASGAGTRCRESRRSHTRPSSRRRNETTRSSRRRFSQRPPRPLCGPSLPRRRGRLGPQSGRAGRCEKRGGKSSRFISPSARRTVCDRRLPRQRIRSRAGLGSRGRRRRNTTVLLSPDEVDKPRPDREVPPAWSLRSPAITAIPDLGRSLAHPENAYSSPRTSRRSCGRHRRGVRSHLSVPA